MYRGILQLVFFLAVLTLAPLSLRIGEKREDPNSRRKQQAELENEQEDLREYLPGVVFMGNSMLFTRIDRAEFKRLSGRRNRFLANPGAASACWYLYLKNILIPSELKPDLVFVFFRDQALTWPEYRTSSYFAQYFRSLQLRDEPVIDRVLYASTSPRGGLPLHISRAAESFYGHRNQAERFQSTVRDFALDLSSFGSGKRERRAYMNARFGLDNLRRDLGADDAASAVERSASDSPQHFAAAPDASFLPHMLDLAEQHGIRLAFYRVKKREDVDGTRPPMSALPGYLRDLQSYVESRGALYFDETGDEIPAGWYADGDHIAREKRDVYTQHFWEKVKGALQGQE